MREQKIRTILGEISVTLEEQDSRPPVVFLHGVFLDSTLWTNYGSDLTNRSHIYIDMPAHGQSNNVGRDWSIDECVIMFMQILDELNIKVCIAVGHSWGSMTILRTAVKYPERFVALGLFNMPFKRSSGMGRLGFTLQKLMVYFPKFYAKQAAKALYTTEFLRLHPELSRQMQERLAQRPPKEISRVIDAVILDAEDTSSLITRLNVPALAIIGMLDYVGVPPVIQTIKVVGGHISPHEAQRETEQAIIRVIGLADSTS